MEYGQRKGASARHAAVNKVGRAQVRTGGAAKTCRKSGIRVGSGLQSENSSVQKGKGEATTASQRAGEED